MGGGSKIKITELGINRTDKGKSKREHFSFRKIALFSRNGTYVLAALFIQRAGVRLIYVNTMG